MIVYLDRQHAGKPSRHGDRGASHGDSVEAMLTPVYLLAMEQQLVDLGHAVIPISDGTYPARHARVVRYGRESSEIQVYCAAHLNSGGGDYGMVLYDRRSSMGLEAASHVVTALTEACPELATVRSVAASDDDWTDDAYATISGVYRGRPCGLCLEPAFIDAADHAELLTSRGLYRLGTAMARGLHAWAESR